MTEAFHRVPIEVVRKYWNARPCNIRHSPQPVGSREYFAEVEKRKYFVEPHIPAFADFASWRGKRVLEIGCGIGTDTMNFARAGADVTAVDLSDKSLELARKRADVLGLSNVEFVNANVEELDQTLPPQTYDLVYSFGVLHHTPRPEVALKQLRRFLTPGGPLKLMMYYRWSWKAFWIVTTLGKGAFWRYDELVARWSEAQTGCPVTYSYSKRDLTELLQATGYRVDDVFVDHIFPWKISEYVQYRYEKVWYFRWLPSAAFRWLERRLGWHLCATARAV